MKMRAVQADGCIAMDKQSAMPSNVFTKDDEVVPLIALRSTTLPPFGFYFLGFFSLWENYFLCFYGKLVLLIGPGMQTNLRRSYDLKANYLGVRHETSQ